MVVRRKRSWPPRVANSSSISRWIHNVSVCTVCTGLMLLTVLVIIPVANHGVTKGSISRIARDTASRPLSRKVRQEVHEEDFVGVWPQVLSVGEEEAIWLEPLDKSVGEWPRNLILSSAVGSQMDDLTILLHSFHKNVRSGAVLVLFMRHKPKRWVNIKNVVLQLYHPPEKGPLANASLQVERFLVYETFLKVIGHRGRVILCDAKDVAFFKDPFVALDDKSLHLFQESSILPTANQKKTNNWNWLALCFDERTANGYAGSHVINAGFIKGTTFQIMSLLLDLRLEFSKVSGACLEAFGADQAVLNHLVKSGLVRMRVPNVKLEDNEHGPVLQRFTKKTPFTINKKKEVLSSIEEKPFAVVHGYSRFPDLNDLVRHQFLSRWSL